MRIAFDAATNGGDNGASTNTRTFAHTVGSGEKRYLLVGVAGDFPIGVGNDDITSVTYNGVAMSLLEKGDDANLCEYAYVYGLANPDSGTHNVVVTAGSNHYLICGAWSGKGINPATVVHWQNMAGSLGTTLTTTKTPGYDNSWLVFFDFTVQVNNHAPTAGTGCTRRQFGSLGAWGVFDTNGPITPIAATSVTTNRDSTPIGRQIHIGVTLAPALVVRDAEFAFEPEFEFTAAPAPAGGGLLTPAEDSLAGYGAEPASSSSISVTLTKNISVGQVLIIRCSTWHDTSEPSGETAFHDNIDDGSANVYTKAKEWSHNHSSSDSGVNLSLWYLVATVQRNIGETVTMNFSGARKGRILALNLYDKGVEANELVFVDVAFMDGEDTTPNVTLNTPEIGDYTWIGAGARDEGNTALTLDGSFVTDLAAITANGNNNTNNSTLWGQYRKLEDATETWDVTLASARDWAMILAAFRVEVAPTGEAIPGMREYQEDFETGTEHLRRASTIRRPDAVSWDYLTAWTMGPKEIGDISEGPRYRRWEVDATEVGKVWIRRSNVAGTRWDDWLQLFEYEDEPIIEISVAFGINATPVVAMERHTGDGGAPETWLWWYDPFYPAYVLVNKGPGRTPRVCSDHFPHELSAHVCPPEVYVHLVHLVPTTGMIRLEESDRFTAEFTTPIGAPSLNKRYIELFYPTKGKRLSVELAQHNTTTGRWKFIRVDSLPVPDSLLKRPRFVNWSDPAQDLYRSSDGLWYAPAGDDDQFLRVEVSQEVDGIQCEAAADFPMGPMPAFGEQFQEQAGPFDPGDARDFTFEMTYGDGTLSLKAFRARTFKVIGEDTCYSPWRYLIVPMAWPTEDALGNPTDTLENCDRDTFINIPDRNIWARGGTVEITRTRITSAHDDTRPFVCPDPAASPPPDWALAGGLENHTGSYPFPTHLQSYGVRRRPIETVDFTDEDYRYIGTMYGAVMESAGGGTPPAYTTLDRRYPAQFPKDNGKFGEPS